MSAVIALVGLTAGGLAQRSTSGAGPGAAQANAAGLPKDVYPDSGFRLPLPKREDLDDEGKKIYDSVSGGTLVGLRGPNGIRLYDPKLTAVSMELNRHLRFETGLSGRVRELAILVTARELNSQFEWAAHEPVALQEGLGAATVDIVRFRRSVDGLPETEAVVIQLGREMFGRQQVTSATFARALKEFGRRPLVDLVALMSGYSGTAALLRAFDMQLPAGQKPPLPMP